MMKHFATSFLLLLTAGWFMPQPCDALTYRLRKVGGGIAPADIIFLWGPAIQGDAVVFLGAAGRGVYRDVRGVVEVVADTETQAPGSTGPFISFQPKFSVSGSDIAFAATTEEGLGIYASRGGLLEQEFLLDAALPGDTGLVVNVNDIRIYGSAVAFGASPGGDSGSPSVYAVESGTVSRVAGGGTVIPGTGDILLGATLLGLDEAGITFAGRIAGGGGGLWVAGVFRSHEGLTTTLVEPGEALPGGQGILRRVLQGFSKRGELSFLGNDFMGHSGVYRLFDGRLSTVADVDSYLPEWGYMPWLDIGYNSFDGGNVAFTAYSFDDSGYPVVGLFQQLGDELVLVVDSDTALDGKRILDLRTGPEGLSGNSVAFLVNLSDASFAVYVAEAVLDDYEPVTADFDGDKKSDVSLYQPRTGTWYMRRTEKDFRTRQFGYSGTQSIPADYDGDGEEDVADYEPSTGNWYLLGSTAGFSTTHFGYGGTDPVPADYDGDGQDDIAVYEPLTGTWYIRESGSGALRIQQWGYAATKPVPADYDDDGKDDICVYEPHTGNWFILQSGSDTLRIQQWGYAATEPVPANFDGGADDIAVYEPETGMWYINGSEGAFRFQQWGYSATDPLPADHDGDGLDDISVYEPSTGTWFTFGSSAGFMVGKL